MKKLTALLFYFSLFSVITTNLFAQTEEDGAYHKTTGKKYSHDEWMAMLPDTFDLFSDNSVLDITIESDFKNLVKTKYKGDYQHAYLIMPISDSVLIKRSIRIKARGEFRRKYCNPPPISLNFKKMEKFTRSNQQLKKMKMVTECKGYKTYEEYVLKEYMVYQMFNLFTDMSFKTRLVKLTYVDTGAKKNKTNVSFAFLIEEEKDLAKRNNMFMVKTETAVQRHVLPESMAQFAMFQYMIGNTDWSVTGRHNVKLLKSVEATETRANAVPYDFDYSGFVNASYAVPTTDFNLDNIRERLFRCECFSRQVFQNTIDRFIELKPQILSTINDFPHASDFVRKDVTNYVNEFYRQIERKNAVEFFVTQCGKLL